MKTKVQIQGSLVWRCGRTKRGNYIAMCDPIGQTVQADNYRELLETMDEALNSTFNELFSTGDLPKFLKERGWTLMSPVPTKKNIRFEMPFDVKGVQNRDFAEALC